MKISDKISTSFLAYADDIFIIGCHPTVVNNAERLLDCAADCNLHGNYKKIKALPIYKKIITDKTLEEEIRKPDNRKIFKHMHCMRKALHKRD